MDSKVILSVFGVILLMGAFYFFFKSFAGHEDRQKAEMEQRVALEKQRQEEEFAVAEKARLEAEARRPFEEAERKKREELEALRRAENLKAYELKLAEQKKKADEDRAARMAKRAADDEARKAGEEGRKGALEEKRRLALEKDEAARLKMLKAHEKAAQAELTAQINAWFANLSQSASSYAIPVTPPPLATVRTAGMAPGVPAPTPDALTGYLTWSSETLLPFARKILLDDAQNEQVRLLPDPALAAFSAVPSAEFAQKILRDIAARTQQLGDAQAETQKQRAVSRNKLTVCMRNLETTVARKRGAEQAESTKDGPELIKNLREQELKQSGELRDLCNAHWKSLNEYRSLIAQSKLLAQARDLCQARLKQLGSEVPAGTGTTKADTPTATTAPAATTTPATPAATTTDKPKVKVYTLKDGRKVRAVTVVTMGDQVALKDETGAIETIDKADVVEIKQE
jgi:hypothetical protein